MIQIKIDIRQTINALPLKNHISLNYLKVYLEKRICEVCQPSNIQFDLDGAQIIIDLHDGNGELLNSNHLVVQLNSLLEREIYAMVRKKLHNPVEVIEP